MANRAIWDVRQRHVWLANPTKSNRPKLRVRKRCGLQAAIERKSSADESGAAAADSGDQSSDS